MKGTSAWKRKHLTQMESLWVRWNFDKASSALVTLKDGTTFELHGAEMWRLLSELSQQWRRPETRELPLSSKTSPASVNDHEPGPQTSWTWETG